MKHAESIQSVDRKKAKRLSFLELVGMLLLGLGLCFAIACIGVAFNDKQAKVAKPYIQQSVEEMRGKLIEANVPDDQIAGLLQIHRNALVVSAVHEHFFISYFLVLLSLLVASFGLTLLLFEKVRTSVR